MNLNHYPVSRIEIKWAWDITDPFASRYDTFTLARMSSPEGTNMVYKLYVDQDTGEIKRHEVITT